MVNVCDQSYSSSFSVRKEALRSQALGAAQGHVLVSGRAGIQSLEKSICLAFSTESTHELMCVHCCWSSSVRLGSVAMISSGCEDHLELAAGTCN